MGSASIVYIPHGGGPLPLMNDPSHAELAGFLRSLASLLPRPEAIVVVSAHWEEARFTVTAAVKPPLLFDYHGFPAETYEYSYPAPGAPELAARVVELATSAKFEARLDSVRGFDHGVFVPLMLMYPDADIPCVQLSLHQSLDAEIHVGLGRALHALGEERVLVLGSGFSFHNMRALLARRTGHPEPRNLLFERWLRETCCEPGLDEDERRQRLVRWQEAPHARYCHPREEHLLPLHVCYGMTERAAELLFQAPVAGFTASAYRWA